MKEIQITVTVTEDGNISVQTGGMEMLQAIGVLELGKSVLLNPAPQEEEEAEVVEEK